MWREEICEAFERSKDRRAAITQIAQATRSDEETVVEVLRQEGLFVSHERCARCGKVFEAFLSPYCPRCDIEKRKEEQRRGWIEYQIMKNEQKRASLLRQMIVLEVENKKLREVLK